jgi:hypothetical protein
MGHLALPVAWAMMRPVAPTLKLSEMPTRDLLALWGQTLRELRDREVVRTFNNPIGDIAEALVALHYEGERGSFSQASWDVKTRAGELLEVKALRRTGAKTRRNLSPVRSDGYNAVIIVIFTEDLRVDEAIRVPREVVNELFAWNEHVAGRIIRVTKKLLEHPEIRRIDLSDELLDMPVKAEV